MRRDHRGLLCARVADQTAAVGRSASPLGATDMNRLIPACALVLGCLGAGAVYPCQCVSSTTEGLYKSSDVVVLATITATRQGMKQWPDPAKAPVRARLVTLKVLKAWKGRYRPGAVIDSWTPYYGASCGYSDVAVGAEVVVFSRREPLTQFFSCSTSAPGHARQTSDNLDGIVGAQSAGVAPNNRSRGP